MPNNYNFIARYYDFISRIVFGKAIVNAQVSLLKALPAKSSMIIIGGGTGWVLEEISKIHQHKMQIDYVENSSAMIELAQKKYCGENKVHFINMQVENYISQNKYDVVMTAFLFDNFREEKIKIVYEKLNALLKNDGLWLYADFTDDKNESRLWQKLLLKTMYIFFRITCNIEAQRLTDMEPFFSNSYSKIAESRFYARFIKAIVYKKGKALHI